MAVQGLTSALKRAGYKSYADYLRSEHWADVKARYRASKLPKKCKVCGQPYYELHHRTYRRLGSERLTDFIALCRDHHKGAHDAYREHRDEGGAESMWLITSRFQRHERRRLARR